MRNVAVFVAAGLLAAAFVVPDAVGGDWSAKKVTGPSWAEFRAELGALKHDAGKLERPRAEFTAEIDVVPIPLDPVTIQPPTALAAVLDVYKDALQSVRVAVADDPHIAAKLKAGGFTADDVLGLAKRDDGAVNVFVGASEHRQIPPHARSAVRK